MTRLGKSVWVIMGLTALPASAQGPIRSVDQLLTLDEASIVRLYQQGQVTGLPPGKVRGTPLLALGTRRAPLVSRGARVFWQGKVVDPDGTGAINRFAGVRVIRGELFSGPSLLDGRPALILDYQRTSHVYEKYRDEIRQIGPGLYVGLMYDRTVCPSLTGDAFRPGNLPIGACRCGAGVPLALQSRRSNRPPSWLPLAQKTESAASPKRS